MLDVHNILRRLLSNYICPSNATVLRRHKARYPHEQAPLIYSAQYGKRNSSVLQTQLEVQAKYFHSSPQIGRTLSGYGTGGGQRCNGIVEGWGDEIAHYYVVEDMLKLDPGQVVWLWEHVTGSGNSMRVDGFEGEGGTKDAVQAFVAGVGGEWFENNGETFAETVAFVVGERGGDMAELRESVEDGVEGVVRRAFV